MNDLKKGNGIASVKNEFLIKASYDLSSNESKLILYLISTINSKNSKDFDLRQVKVKDLKAVFIDNKKRWGSFHSRLDDMCRSIMSSPIMLPKGFMLNGEPIKMHEYIHWFSKISPKYDKDGDIAIEFYFHDDVKPFLLSLRERFVQIDVKKEYFPFTGKYTLHLYPAFKAARNEDKSHYPNSNKTALTYGLDELRAKLGVSNKYKSFKNFRVRVLEPMVNEINEKSTFLNISYEFLRAKGRKISAIKFIISDVLLLETVSSQQGNFKKVQIVDYVPTEKDIEQLTWAERNAYDKLIEFGVKEGIAIKQMIVKVKGGDMEGFEDLFIEKALDHFKKWAKQQKNQEQSAGTFVNWWTKQKVFDQGKDVFWKISEAVNLAKKTMEQVRLDNRRIAKDMTKSAFVTWYKAQENEN